MRALLIATVGLLPLAGRAQPPPPASAAEEAPAEADEAPAAPQSMGTLAIDADDGVEVRVDDAVIGETPLPGPWTLSPGEHTVELRPPSGEPTVRRVTIAAGQHLALDLGGKKPDPAAEPAPAPTSDPAVAEPALPAGPGFPVATGGYIVAGLGLLGVGAGVGLGLLADGYAADARDLDRASNDRADQQALVDQADGAAFWSNVSYGAGGVMLLGGAAMILLATDGPLGVSVAPTPGGAMVEGRF